MSWPSHSSPGETGPAKQVQLEHARPDEKRYGNPLLGRIQAWMVQPGPALLHVNGNRCSW